ncbi:MAG: AzlC family ABC transporter permease [Treponema sp.]|nr:AzlC family ABC transporter permease [Treponema sp.]
MLDQSNFRKAVKTTIPVFFGYIAIGIPFGLMLVNAGYPWWLAPVMSIFIYAGAGQYMAVGLFAAGMSLHAILVAEFFVNIRHIVYGLSLISKFKPVGKIKYFLMFALTDETYALLTMVNVPKDADAGSYYGTIALFDWLYWIAGGVIGALIGTVIPFDFAGVDFALTALFTVMLINQIKASRDILPPVIGIVTTVVAIVLSRVGILPGEHILLVAIALGLFALVSVRGRKFRAEQLAQKLSADGETTQGAAQ